MRKTLRGLRFLRLDALSPLRNGLRFLRRGGETLFCTESVRFPCEPLSASEAARLLTERSASIRLATLWDIAEQRLQEPVLLSLIERCLSDSDRDIPPFAAETLASFGPGAASAVPELVRALTVAAPGYRVAFIRALGAIAARADIAVPALVELLAGQPEPVVSAAVTALRAFGRDAEVASVPLLEAFRVALIGCRGNLADDLALTLNAAVPDAIPRAKALLEGDRELRGRAVGLLKAAAQAGELPCDRFDGATRVSSPRPKE